MKPKLILTLKEQVRAFEQRAIRQAAKAEPNKTRLAAILGITTETLRRKLAEK